MNPVRIVILCVLFLGGICAGFVYHNNITKPLVVTQVREVHVPVTEKSGTVTAWYKDVETIKYNEAGKVQTVIVAEEILCRKDKPTHLKNPLIFEYDEDGNIKMKSTSDFGECEMSSSDSGVTLGDNLRLWGNVKIKTFPKKEKK